ncbi:LOW QUALITY PROTEIN: olfactory receptor 11A1-like [Syngnathoides biaculeatus]|uniref:LOW QUALITY PROTEIN: olfactory receptor 11A1-like n=1 Tax=Syngnathoides biaculeatus TaxID=300417 RepID=UPI002ADDD393|nr:LOW QUALITY PROTEIN: olfactory receptor 11A1-like [Syngnathoides biaculeatus]
MEWNGTLVLGLGGYVEIEKYRYVYLMFFMALYVVILCCNCVIICVIWIHRNLHEPMYIFIASLSLNSLVFSTAIYPKLIVDVLSQRQSVSYTGCLVQTFFFYSLASSDLMLLSAMAYDRYVSICRPLQYATIMGMTTVRLFLALAWFWSTCHLLVAIIIQSKQKICHFNLDGIFCNTTMIKIHCTTPMYLSVWTLFSLINIGLIPVLFILFTYIKIFIVIYHSHGEVRKKAVDMCLPHLIVLITFSCLVFFDIAIGLLESVLPKTVRLIMSLQIVVYSPLFNPIIYGLKMKEIWKPIKRLFCCNYD